MAEGRSNALPGWLRLRLALAGSFGFRPALAFTYSDFGAGFGLDLALPGFRLDLASFWFGLIWLWIDFAWIWLDLA